MTEASRQISIRFRVTGRVQGVGFRAWTQDTAQALGLAGWVRNEADGTVRGEATGADDDVHRLLEALRQGPPGARVRSVETDAACADAAPSRAGFEVRR